MIKTHKIWRELKRIFFQAVDLPLLVLEYFLATSWYDYVLSKRKTVTINTAPDGEKFAAYLIFPNKGLLKSHLVALAYLKRHGYNVVVVSNLPLSPSDRGEVLKSCWALIERPNYGYDFGGYRDAVLMLEPYFQRMKRLVLLNDSTWFPLPGKSDWLADVEAKNVDFCGAISGYGIRREEAKDYPNLQWNFSTKHPEFHYCSFALAFSQRVIADPKFIQFWKCIRLTKRKNKTVRRGEIGLSQCLIGAGFTHDSTLNLESMEAGLQKLPVERIAEITHCLILPLGEKLRLSKQTMVSSISMTEEWRQLAIKYILSCSVLQGSSYSTAEFHVNENSFPFLKKSPLAVGGESAEISLAILKKLEGDSADIFYQEALAMASRGK